MHRKLAFLLWAFLVLQNQAYAQSSHDALGGADPDLAETGSGDFGLSSADGKYKLRLRGHVQENNSYTYTKATDKHNVNIEINRARFSVTGNVFDPRLSYLFQTGFENDGREDPRAKIPGFYTSPGSRYLRDYYLNWALNQEFFHIRIGKFRTPFSRQQLMSTSQMQFHDQSAANEAFQLTNTGRDVGVMFHNGFNNQFEGAFVAVSNGLVARVGYNHGGIDAYDFTDFSGGPFRLAIAANGFLHTKYEEAKLDDARGGADFLIKVEGFSANGAFYYQWLKREGADKAANNLGGGLDLGYLIQKQVEPVLRYSWIKPDGEKAAQLHEILGGINYYVIGHHLKVQGYGGTALADKEILRWLGGVQFQLAI